MAVRPLVAKKIIYLVTGSCYFSDDPDKVHTKEWHLDAYDKESDAWNRVEELRIKENIRRVNSSPDDWDFSIRNEYSVDCIMLFG